MINEIFEEYGEQITAAIEVFLFITLVAGLFFGGAIGNIVLSISDGIC